MIYFTVPQILPKQARAETTEKPYSALAKLLVMTNNEKNLGLQFLSFSRPHLLTSPTPDRKISINTSQAKDNGAANGEHICSVERGCNRMKVEQR